MSHEQAGWLLLALTPIVLSASVYHFAGYFNGRYDALARKGDAQ